MHVIGDFTAPLTDAKNIQMNMCVFIVMFAVQPRIGANDVDTKFLVQFAHQCRRCGFAGLDFAAGEFPIAGIDRAGRALAEEKFAVSTFDNGRGDVNGFWGFQLLTPCDEHQLAS